MLIPIRCMTCGKPIGHLWDDYEKAIKKGKKAKDILDTLGLERYCCRSLFLTNVDLVPRVAMFKR